jgi:hypothetical protein
VTDIGAFVPSAGEFIELIQRKEDPFFIMHPYSSGLKLCWKVEGIKYSSHCAMLVIWPMVSAGTDKPSPTCWLRQNLLYLPAIDCQDMNLTNTVNEDDDMVQPRHVRLYAIEADAA